MKGSYSAKVCCSKVITLSVQFYFQLVLKFWNAPYTPEQYTHTTLHYYWIHIGCVGILILVNIFRAKTNILPIAA